MCGILAQINFETNTEKFVDALNLQEHRGPDDSGVKIVDNNILGHRRLSIIDLDPSAAQPMSYNDRVHIVFNGEIYNYKELKDQLVAKGYVFETNGDTEVLLALYCEYGISFLEKLIGMFAFVLYDSKEKRTYIVRDRLGIKPLYYYSEKGRYVFSSEIKSIKFLLDNKLTLNENAISSYLSFRYPILNDTFFTEVNSIEPGTYLVVKGDSHEKVIYWGLASSFQETGISKSENQYIDDSLDLLKSAVKYRQIADVKIGAYLSGGVDSSAIVALMSEKAKENIQTFTIGFDEEGYNEFEFSKEVASAYGTDHHEIVLKGNDYFSTMEKLIGYKDAPLSVPNEVPLYLMSKELKKYITVVLSGEGADEIFLGYGRIYRAHQEFIKSKTILQKVDKSEKEMLFLNRLKEKYGTYIFEDEVDHFYRIYSYTSEELKGALLSNKSHNEDITSKLKQRFRDLFDEVGSEQPYINKMIYAFEKVHLVGLLLRVDTTTMATSVEARVPFVDHRLVEFICSIPYDIKMKWASDELDENDLFLSEDVSEVHDIPKYVLKKALEPYLSNNILYRKKMGFPVPLDKWLGGEFKLHVDKLLDGGGLHSQNLINMEEIKSILESGKLSTNHSLAMKLWMLMNLEIFYKNNFL